MVVISEQFWRDHLGHDPNVLNQTLTLDGKQHTIVGVMPDNPATHAERQAIEDALSSLRVLKRDKLGFPDREKK